jgi:hypothetical protein
MPETCGCGQRTVIGLAHLVAELPPQRADPLAQVVRFNVGLVEQRARAYRVGAVHGSAHELAAHQSTPVRLQPRLGGIELLFVDPGLLVAELLGAAHCFDLRRLGRGHELRGDRLDQLQGAIGTGVGHRDFEDVAPPAADADRPAQHVAQVRVDQLVAAEAGVTAAGTLSAAADLRILAQIGSVDHRAQEQRAAHLLAHQVRLRVGVRPAHHLIEIARQLRRTFEHERHRRLIDRRQKECAEDPREQRNRPWDDQEPAATPQDPAQFT